MRILSHVLWVGCIVLAAACRHPSGTTRAGQQNTPHVSNATPAAPQGRLRAGAVHLGSDSEPNASPEVDRQLPAKQRRWCGAPRGKDPLIDEAIRMASANDKDSFAISGRTHKVPILSPEVVFFVRDEAICERAARAFDKVNHGEFVVDHDGPYRVLVVQLGDVFVVEAARPRRQGFTVYFFDLSWQQRGIPYGAGH